MQPLSDIVYIVPILRYSNRYYTNEDPVLGETNYEKIYLW